MDLAGGHELTELLWIDSKKSQRLVAAEHLNLALTDRAQQAQRVRCRDNRLLTNLADSQSEPSLHLMSPDEVGLIYSRGVAGSPLSHRGPSEVTTKT